MKLCILDAFVIGIIPHIKAVGQVDLHKKQRPGGDKPVNEGQ